MSSALEANGATPSGVSRAVDQACNRFEAAWRSGQRPRLEEFLAAAPEAERSALLRELLAIEVDYRRSVGEGCRAEEYQARFPTLGAGELAELLADEAPPPVGATARYRVLRFHAKGGLGEVHVAYDSELRREVALKRMQDRHHGDPESYRRFLREAEVTARLEHPGVVPVHGLTHDRDGGPCYVMRFIEGESLKDALRRLHGAGEAGTPELTLRQLLTRLVTACQTIAYAHSRGILHRDLKPANIMLGKYGETLVVDWGLAKAVGSEKQNHTTAPPRGDGRPAPEFNAVLGEATHTGSALGTPAYMSPEQAAGNAKEIGPASDIYGLGATLYAVLTGRAPFQETPADAPLAPVQLGTFPLPRQVKPDVPRALEAICLKAMARQPEDRYASALDLAADLERWLAGEPVAAYPEPWAQRLGRWMKRRRTLVTAAAALIVGAVPLLATLVVLLERDRAAIEKERGIAQGNADRAVAAMKQACKAVHDMGYQAQAGVLSAKVIRQQNLRVARQNYGDFLRQYPDDFALAVQLTEFHFHYAWCCMEIGDWKDAIAAYQEAQKGYEWLDRQVPNPKYPMRQAICWFDLGQAHHALGQTAEAERAIRQGVNLQEEQVQTNKALVHQSNLAYFRADLGAFLRDIGRTEESRNVLQTARAQWESILALALKDKVDSPRTQACRVGLVLTLARLGDYAKAQEHLPELARLLATTTREDYMYNSIRAYALLAGDPAPGAPVDAFATQAVELLRKVISRDFINLERLRNDPELQTLRGRDDFQEIVRGLEERVRAGFK